MGRALPGEHYCLAHQGNHSHYDKHNCVVCQQAARIAELERLNSAMEHAIEALRTQFEQRGIPVDPEHPDRIAVELGRAVLEVVRKGPSNANAGT